MSPARRAPPLTDAQALSSLLDDAYREADDWHVRFEQVKLERDGMLVLLEDCSEFIEQYEEADCQGDPPQMVPNRAMRLRKLINETLERFPEGR